MRMDTSASSAADASVSAVTRSFMRSGARAREMEFPPPPPAAASEEDDVVCARAVLSSITREASRVVGCGDTGIGRSSSRRGEDAASLERREDDERAAGVSVAAGERVLRSSSRRMETE